MILAQTLRDAILQAAMQGKLTEQLSSDSSAENMFRTIEAEKSNGIKSKKIKRDKSCSIKKYNPIEDGIFEIPDSWCWVKLGELCQKVGAGSTPSGGSKVYVSKGVKFLREQNVRNEGILYEGIVYITEEMHSLMGESKVVAKDILLNITGASIGRNSLVPDDFDTANVNQHVLVIRLIDERLRLYLHLCLQAPFVYNQMMAEQKGDKPGLSATRVSNFLIPLPPIEEQQRIVDRVNELLAKVDEFEKIENELTAVKEKFPSDLRAAILQAAMQGKLTEQLDTDTPLSSLIDKASTMMDNSIDGQRVKDKNVLPINESDIPFDIPASWKWVRLGEVCVIARGGSPRPISAYLTTESSGVNWIKIGDTEKNGKYIFKTAEKIKPEGVIKSRMVHDGDFLLTNSMSYGRPYILKTDGCIHDGWLVISQPVQLFDQDYLYWLLSSDFAYNQFSGQASGGVVKNLNSDKVANSIFPLPPLEEQQRIVERLDALLPLCDELMEE